MKSCRFLIVTLVVAATVACISRPVYGQVQALIELQSANETYQGKLVAHNSHACWLLGRDGRINEVQIESIVKHRTVVPRFRRFSTTEIRDQLRREFGREFEVVGTGHYLVCAAKGRARKFGQLFEEVYRTFYGYFARRRFQIDEPEFPLIAIVFPNRAQFVEYSRRDEVVASRGMMGYYLPLSNRIALFESNREALSAGVRPTDTVASPLRLERLFQSGDGGPSSLTRSARPFGAIGSWRGNGGDIESGLEGVIVHETTHQVAFNTGLHSRIGENSMWVVEGLATVFEAPGIREASGSRNTGARINRSRFLWFKEFAISRRRPKSLADFVASDAMFKRQRLDAYSQAWALTFFLIETRPSEYSRYLKEMTQRDPLKSYPPEARLADFKQAFGDDLKRLDDNFLRFMQKLK
jgi:hypothetical protein